MVMGRIAGVALMAGVGLALVTLGIIVLTVYTPRAALAAKITLALTVLAWAVGIVAGVLAGSL